MIEQSSTDIFTSIVSGFLRNLQLEIVFIHFTIATQVTALIFETGICRRVCFSARIFASVYSANLDMFLPSVKGLAQLTFHF